MDIARNADTHVHRIGRTGRAGNKGDAISLLTPMDGEFAGIIVRSIETTKQVKKIRKFFLDFRCEKNLF